MRDTMTAILSDLIPDRSHLRDDILELLFSDFARINAGNPTGNIGNAGKIHQFCTNITALRSQGWSLLSCQWQKYTLVKQCNVLKKRYKLIINR